MYGFNDYEFWRQRSQEMLREGEKARLARSGGLQSRRRPVILWRLWLKAFRLFGRPSVRPTYPKSEESAHQRRSRCQTS